MTEIRTSPEPKEQELRVFETFAPRVFPKAKPFLLLAEETGALARLKPQQGELLVEYVTSDITMKELGGFLGVSTQAVSQRIDRCLKLLWKDMSFNHKGRFKELLLAYASLNTVRKIKSSGII